MFARAGDRIVVHGLHVDQAVRDGKIIEVQGPNGSPPYLVRWHDTGHEALVFPGSDAVIEGPPPPVEGKQAG